MIMALRLALLIAPLFGIRSKAARSSSSVMFSHPFKKYAPGEADPAQCQRPFFVLEGRKTHPFFFKFFAGRFNHFNTEFCVLTLNFEFIMR
jgi:hypothetical protein